MDYAFHAVQLEWLVINQQYLRSLAFFLLASLRPVEVSDVIVCFLDACNLELVVHVLLQPDESILVVKLLGYVLLVILLNVVPPQELGFLFDQGVRTNEHRKRGADIWLTLHRDVSPHLLNYQFTNTES